MIIIIIIIIIIITILIIIIVIIITILILNLHRKVMNVAKCRYNFRSKRLKLTNMIIK